MAISRRDLCQKNRGFRFETASSRQSVNQARAQFMTEAVRNCLKYRVRDLASIAEYLQSVYFTSDAFANPQAKSACLINDAMLVRRAVNAVPDAMLDKMFIFDPDTPERALCDAMFVDQESRSMLLVKHFIGKAAYTQTGNANALCRDLNLYELIKLGRMQAGMIFTGSDPVMIRAEYRYLRKDTDRTNALDPEFYGNNIISMDDHMGLDTEMAEKEEKRRIGLSEEDIPEEDCTICKNYQICKFTRPASPIPVTPAGNKNGKIFFSPAQQEVINWVNGVLCVIAGAGAGKTACIVEHVVRLLTVENVDPEHILMITFTVAGANEMRERIRKRLEEERLNLDVELIKIMTFNAFANEVVMDRYYDVGLCRKPTVLMNCDRLDIIDRMITENPVKGWSGRAFRQYDSQESYGKGALLIAADVFSAIKEIRAKGLTPDALEIRKLIDVADTSDAVLGELIQRYDIYDRELKRLGLIEFSDQEPMMFEIFQKNPGYLQEKYPVEHVVVDEFQDSSEGQVRFIDMLTMLPSWRSLVVVGDDAQSIFGFRGTSPEYILNLNNYLTKPVYVKELLDNFRSRQKIIDVANAENRLRKNKIDKDLIANRDGGRVQAVGFYKSNGLPFANTQAEWKNVGEVDWTVMNILKLLVMDGYAPEDIAVITYTKAELERYADALTNAGKTIKALREAHMFDFLNPAQQARMAELENGIPSMFCAPEPLMDNSRINAVLAFGRYLANRQDTAAALIVYNCMIGGGVMSLPESQIQDGLNRVKMMAQEIDSKFSLPDKKALFMAFIDSIMDGDEAVESFRDSLKNREYDEILHYLSVFARFGKKDTYKRERKYPGITLVTAHSAKGLEWPVVFNSVSKYQKKKMTRNSIEEVRRLLFVSETRARDELYITGLYSVAGKGDERVYNMFLHDAFDCTGTTWNPDFD